jgi:hypothetical protein
VLSTKAMLEARMVETSIQFLARSEHGTRASADRNKISSQGARISEYGC